MTSRTTCSGRAELSTIMAFWPPVSAMKGMGEPAPGALRAGSGKTRLASWRWISLAVSVEPVNKTPQTCGAPTKAAPTSPAPVTNCSARGGTPASCKIATASAAMSGVSSAGLARTVLPVTRPAATWPRKIASGKFQGLMQTRGPSGVAPAKQTRACWA